MEEFSPLLTLLACIGIATLLIFFWNLIQSPLVIINHWYEKKDSEQSKLKQENENLKAQLRTYQTKTLKIAFDHTDPSYITPEIQMRPKLFRVSIRNISHKTSENVAVKLTRISSWLGDMGVLPITLKKKDAKEPYPLSFTINAQDNEFVDVLKVTRIHGHVKARGIELDAGIPYFEFCSADQAHLMIPALLDNPYEITIEVTGDGTLRDRRNFVFGQKQGGEFFMEILPLGGNEACPEGNISV